MIILVIGLIIIDIVSKLIVKKYLIVHKSIVIIKNFLNITYVKNTGAAWSIFDNNSLLVLIISGLVIGYIIYYLEKHKPSRKIEKIAYSFILAGALGNFINRLVYGYVIDFIDVKIFGYNYPIFNIADIFIVVGVIVLIIDTWRCNHDGVKSRR